MALLPYGGFGDPDNPTPYWKPPKGSDPHKVSASKAQDRFMRSVRIQLRQLNMSDEELEQQLGYRRYGLTRKLNGQELMTIRDVLSLSELFPGSLLTLADTENSRIEVAETQPPFKSGGRRRPDFSNFHDALQRGISLLEDAAQNLADLHSEKDARLAPILRSLATTANEIGRAVVSPAHKSK